MQNRTLWALLTVLVGGLQALDSGALRAGAGAQALIVLGVAAPACALALSERWGVRVTALGLGAGLFVWARVISPVPLNTLHIGLIVPAMYIFFVSRLEKDVAHPDRRGTQVTRV
jgi:hypothetical protein